MKMSPLVAALVAAGYEVCHFWSSDEGREHCELTIRKDGEVYDLEVWPGLFLCPVENCLEKVDNPGDICAECQSYGLQPWRPAA